MWGWQVLGAALELCARDPSAAGSYESGRPAAEAITQDMRSICLRADEVSAL